jgi:hypothetical protein
MSLLHGVPINLTLFYAEWGNMPSERAKIQE